MWGEAKRHMEGDAVGNMAGDVVSEEAYCARVEEHTSKGSAAQMRPRWGQQKDTSSRKTKTRKKPGTAGRSPFIQDLDPCTACCLTKGTGVSQG